MSGVVMLCQYIDGQFCVTRLAQTRVEVDPADDANSAPTPVARRTRTAPVKAAKRIIPAPANRRVKARATDSSAPEEEDPFLLCLEDCIIPADQSQKLLRDSVIFRQRSGASSSQTADAVPSATPVARRTRNKQQSQPAATQVDDTLEGTLVETQASSQVPFLATQVCDDVSGLEYVITQQEDACAVITVPAQSSSQLSGLSSQEVLFGPSHWFDPAVSGSSSSGAGAGASQTMAATIASIEAQVNPASSTSTSATTTTTAAASQSQELDKTVVRRIVPHRSPSRDQIKSPVTKAGSSAAAAAKSPVTKAGSSAAAAAKSPATKPGSSAVAAAAAKSPATKAGSSVAAAVAAKSPATKPGSSAVAAAAAKSPATKAGSSAAAAAKSPVTKAGSSVAAAAAAKSPATKAGSSAAAAAKSPVTKAGSSAAAAAAKSPVPKAGSSAVSTAAAIVPKSEPAQTVQDDESIDFDDLTQKQYPQQPRGGPPARAMAPSSAKVIEIPAEPLRRKREEPPAGPSKRPAKTKVGRRVSKFFGPQYGHYKGIVTALNSATGYYMIEYEDGDAEEMTELELCKFLIPAMMC